MILIYSIDQQRKEAQAFLPLLGLAPEVVAVCAGLLTVAGIEFSTDEAVRAAGYKFYQDSSALVRSGFDKAVLAGGLLVVTTEMWLSAKNFARTNFVDTTTQNVDTLIFNETSVIHSADASHIGVLNLVGNSYGMLDFTTSVYNYQGGALWFPTGFGLIQAQRDYIDNVWSYSNWYRNYSTTPATEVFLSRTTGLPGVQLATIFSTATSHFVVINGITVWTQDTNLPFAGTIMVDGINDVTVANALSKVVTLSPANYTVNNNYYDNPAVDRSGDTLKLPTAIPQVMGKTADNVAVDSPKTADDARAAAIAAALAAGLTLAQATAAGEAAYAKAMTESVAVSNTLLGKIATVAGTITTALDFTAPLDVAPLAYAGTLFTTRFPFSLPWDLKNMLVSFGAGSAAAPSFHIKFMTVDTNMSMTQFDSLAAVARIVELFVFNIALLFGTRKLLGGAT